MDDVAGAGKRTAKTWAGATRPRAAAPSCTACNRGAPPSSCVPSCVRGAAGSSRPPSCAINYLKASASALQDVVTQALCSQHYRQLGLQGLHQLYAHSPIISEMRSCISIGDGKSSHCCSDICSLGAGGLSRSAVPCWRMPFSSERSESTHMPPCTILIGEAITSKLYKMIYQMVSFVAE